jgi:hypothetical protein
MLGKVVVNPVVTNTNDSGPGSLRQAILDLNADPDLTQITFAIPGGGVHTITPLSALPVITGPVVLDATSQPGWAPGVLVIQLNGSSAGPSANGLSIQGGGTTVRGLVINGFAQSGIVLQSNGNTITGNFIGTNAAGNAASANSGDGVVINGGASGNTVGSQAGLGNVISGNAGNGISISGGDSNTVVGNFIGTDVSGNAAVGNGNGILVSSATNTFVGNALPGGRNIISGNVSDGVDIVTANTNFVYGNFIGTNAAGTAAVGNGGNGMTINTRGNFIGGPGASGRNVISGNGNHGILVSDSNVVEGNFIGTNASGSAALGNAGYGVAVMNAGCPIGGTLPGAGNVISGNALGGVLISGAAAIGTSVFGNLIGTNAAGTSAVGNGGNGILINGGAESCRIGGTAASARNVISGNIGSGVVITDVGTSFNQVQGNLIGLDVSGTLALANSGGVSISGSATSNTVGGSATGAQNVISGNLQHGVAISGSGTNSNQVAGNCIGTDVNCAAPVGNLGDGVRIDSGAANNVIGNSAGNVIAFNGKGVVVTGDGTTVGNAIEGNVIFSNSGLGIDLNDDGVTNNDSSGHTGPNNFQNFPVLTSAVLNGSTTTVSGALHSAPNTSFHIEFFGTPACDGSGHGQGRSLLGTSTVGSDGSGDASLNFSFPTSLIGTGLVSATATDAAGNTSEFSACQQTDYALTNAVGRTLRVRLGQPFTFVVASFTDTDPGGSVSDFATTTIDWGDGTAPTTATVVSTGGQNYNVIGTHAYTKVGSWNLTVTIKDSVGASAGAGGQVRLWPKAFSY